MFLVVFCPRPDQLYLEARKARTWDPGAQKFKDLDRNSQKDRTFNIVELKCQHVYVLSKNTASGSTDFRLQSKKLHFIKKLNLVVVALTTTNL